MEFNYITAIIIITILILSYTVYKRIIMESLTNVSPLLINNGDDEYLNNSMKILKTIKSDMRNKKCTIIPDAHMIIKQYYSSIWKYFDTIPYTNNMSVKDKKVISIINKQKDVLKDFAIYPRNLYPNDYSWIDVTTKLLNYGIDTMNFYIMKPFNSTYHTDSKSILIKTMELKKKLCP